MVANLGCVTHHHYFFSHNFLVNILKSNHSLHLWNLEGKPLTFISCFSCSCTSWNWGEGLTLVYGLKGVVLHGRDVWEWEFRQPLTLHPKSGGRGRTPMSGLLSVVSRCVHSRTPVMGWYHRIPGGSSLFSENSLDVPSVPLHTQSTHTQTDRQIHRQPDTAHTHTQTHTAHTYTDT